jgi:hypothetical protein
MRKRLAELKNRRCKFRAVVERFGKQVYKSKSYNTILVTFVTLTDLQVEVADHCWISIKGSITKLGLKPGDEIEFEALVKQYTKGYKSNKYGINKQRTEYGLQRATNFRRVDL